MDIRSHFLNFDVSKYIFNTFGDGELAGKGKDERGACPESDDAFRIDIDYFNVKKRVDLPTISDTSNIQPGDLKDDNAEKLPVKFSLKSQTSTVLKQSNSNQLEEDVDAARTLPRIQEHISELKAASTAHVGNDNKENNDDMEEGEISNAESPVKTKTDIFSGKGEQSAATGDLKRRKSEVSKDSHTRTGSHQKRSTEKYRRSSSRSSGSYSRSSSSSSQSSYDSRKRKRYKKSYSRSRSRSYSYGRKVKNYGNYGNYYNRRNSYNKNYKYVDYHKRDYDDRYKSDKYNKVMPKSVRSKKSSSSSMKTKVPGSRSKRYRGQRSSSESSATSKESGDEKMMKTKKPSSKKLKGDEESSKKVIRKTSKKAKHAAAAEQQQQPDDHDNEEFETRVVKQKPAVKNLNDAITSLTPSTIANSSVISSSANINSRNNATALASSSNINSSSIEKQFLGEKKAEKIASSHRVISLNRLKMLCAGTKTDDNNDNQYSRRHKENANSSSNPAKRPIHSSSPIPPTSNPPYKDRRSSTKKSSDVHRSSSDKPNTKYNQQFSWQGGHGYDEEDEEEMADDDGYNYENANFWDLDPLLVNSIQMAGDDDDDLILTADKIKELKSNQSVVGTQGSNSNGKDSALGMQHANDGDDGEIRKQHNASHDDDDNFDIDSTNTNLQINKSGDIFNDDKLADDNDDGDNDDDGRRIDDDKDDSDDVISYKIISRQHGIVTQSNEYDVNDYVGDDDKMSKQPSESVVDDNSNDRNINYHPVSNNAIMGSIESNVNIEQTILNTDASTCNIDNDIGKDDEERIAEEDELEENIKNPVIGNDNEVDVNDDKMIPIDNVPYNLISDNKDDNGGDNINDNADDKTVDESSNIIKSASDIDKVHSEISVQTSASGTVQTYSSTDVGDIMEDEPGVETELIDLKRKNRYKVGVVKKSSKPKLTEDTASWVAKTASQRNVTNPSPAVDNIKTNINSIEDVISCCQLALSQAIALSKGGSSFNSEKLNEIVQRTMRDVNSLKECVNADKNPGAISPPMFDISASQQQQQKSFSSSMKQSMESVMNSTLNTVNGGLNVDTAAGSSLYSPQLSPPPPPPPPPTLLQSKVFSLQSMDQNYRNAMERMNVVPSTSCTKSFIWKSSPNECHSVAKDAETIPCNTLSVEMELRKVLKPMYTKGEITKEQYKEIMRKAVTKICLMKRSLTFHELTEHLQMFIDNIKR